MKIVIDIPKSTYKVFKNLSEIIGILVYEKDILTLIKAVKNGTPLPKGHGRLIDADVLVDGMEDDYEFCETVNATPTIIEADGGNAE